MEADEVLITAARYDPVDQAVRAMQLFLRDGRVEMRPVHLRFAYPSELDLMARVAGLRLRERWGGRESRNQRCTVTGMQPVFEVSGTAWRRYRSRPEVRMCRSTPQRLLGGRDRVFEVTFLILHQRLIV